MLCCVFLLQGYVTFFFAVCHTGGDQQYGIPLDESHKPSFPGVDYRQHVPYAETGPSSDVRPSA